MNTNKWWFCGFFLWLSACSLSQIDQSHLCRIWKSTQGTSACIGWAVLVTTGWMRLNYSAQFWHQGSAGRGCGLEGRSGRKIGDLIPSSSCLHVKTWLGVRCRIKNIEEKKGTKTMWWAASCLHTRPRIAEAAWCMMHIGFLWYRAPGDVRYLNSAYFISPKH